MRKILSLGPQQWVSGTAQGYNYGSGIWAGSSSGINPFVNAERANSQVGLLQAGPVVSDLTASTVTDTPIGYITDFSSTGVYTFYFSGTGKFYSSVLNTLSVGAVTLLRTVANMANGLAVLKAGSETKYLYYWQKDQIGRYALDGSTFIDAHFTGLISTVHHPAHKYQDIIFYGNSTTLGTIGRIKNESNVATHTPSVVDFGQDYTITTISDDGQYIVVGATKNIGGGSTVYPGTKILFWDGGSTLPEKEWDLPAPDVISIKKTPSGMYALTSTGIFIFNFSTAPRKVYSLGASDTVGVSATTGAHYSMDVLGDGVLWGSANRLHYYGKFLPDMPVAYHQLFSVPSGTATLVCTTAGHQLVLVGTTTPKFGYYNFSNGTPDTGVAAESISIDLKDRYSIRRIDVILGVKLASGDSVNIGVSSVKETSLVDFGGTNAVSFANYGAESFVILTGTSLVAENLIIKPTFVGGTVKIKRIDIWGEKLDM